eukprot:Opistho-2@5527
MKVMEQTPTQQHRKKEQESETERQRKRRERKRQGQDTMKRARPADGTECTTAQQLLQACLTTKQPQTSMQTQMTKRKHTHTYKHTRNNHPTHSHYDDNQEHTRHDSGSSGDRQWRTIHCGTAGATADPKKTHTSSRHREMGWLRPKVPMYSALI